MGKSIAAVYQIQWAASVPPLDGILVVEMLVHSHDPEVCAG